jgi:hypothetical protein
LERSQFVVAALASVGRLTLAQVSPARAVTPAPRAPTADDRPQPPPAPVLAASSVALAPAAMGALIEAQAQMSQEASVLARQDTARKIDRLIEQLDGDPPPPRSEGAPFTVRRLQVARQALA